MKKKKIILFENYNPDKINELHMESITPDEIKEYMNKLKQHEKGERKITDYELEVIHDILHQYLREIGEISFDDIP